MNIVKVAFCICTLSSMALIPMTTLANQTQINSNTIKQISNAAQPKHLQHYPRLAHGVMVYGGYGPPRWRGGWRRGGRTCRTYVAYNQRFCDRGLRCYQNFGRRYCRTSYRRCYWRPVYASHCFYRRGW